MILHVTDRHDVPPTMLTLRRNYYLDLSIFGGEFDLESFLSSCRIPFVYAWNKPNRAFERLSSFEQGFFIAKLMRCTASLPIKFKLEDSFIDKSIAFECKNREKSVDCGEIVQIFGKALNHNECNLSIVFSNSFSNTSLTISKVSSVSNLTIYCRENAINLYRVRKVSYLNYKMEKFEPKTPITTSPKLVCIVFESDLINKTENAHYLQAQLSSALDS